MRPLVFALLALTACWKPFAPSRPSQVAFEPRVHSFRLGNGLTTVVIPDPSAVEVQVTMHYAVGAIDDPRGQEGMAHLVEHLMFQQVVDGESLFAGFERDATTFNAFTLHDTTLFAARTAPSKLQRFLALEAARLRLRCETLDDAVFAREREVVRNELRLKADAIAVDVAIHEGLYARARAPQTPDSIAAITREQACAFADAHYTPGNAVLVVSGKLTIERIEADVRAALAAIPTRPRGQRPVVARGPRQTVTKRVPIDQPAVVYAWSMPADHAQRTRARAVARILVDHVDADIRGTVALREYGGDVLALVAIPATGEAVSAVRGRIEQLVDELPLSFSNLRQYDDTFDHAHQLELARFYEMLEDGGGRDEYVAVQVRAGRDPGTAIAQGIQALVTLDRGTASTLAASVLGRSAASVITLEPQVAARTGLEAQLTPVLHDAKMRRLLDEPAAAERPASELALPPDRAITRTLASGIRVVLLPSASPTAEVRLVFATGLGDERAGQRGAALLAAHALEPAQSDVADFNRFYTSGGRLSRDVGLDHTTFVARGLARDFDRLVIALELLVRNGEYRSIAKMLERLRALPDPDAAIDVAWRTAIYGRGHTYAARAGRPSDLGTLDASVVSAFRNRHYRADALTIIVAGGFDPKLADAWIDHQFATWVTEGALATRSATRARVMPVALAAYEDTTMVQVQIALPISGPREHQLVVAALIDQTIADVRNQLGAAYALSAALDESRLSSVIRIAGHVDAKRAAEALGLVRERLAALVEPTDATASRFVAARRRVIADLSSMIASSRDVAERAERDTVAGRIDVDAVRRLRRTQLEPALRGVTLATAAILLRGPHDQILDAYRELGREPTVVK